MLYIFIYLFIIKCYSLKYTYGNDSLIIHYSIDEKEELITEKIPNKVNIIIEENVTDLILDSLNDFQLLSISIPASLIFIDLGMIQCHHLSKIDLNPKNNYFCFENGILFEKSTNKAIFYLNEEKRESFV